MKRLSSRRKAHRLKGAPFFIKCKNFFLDYWAHALGVVFVLLFATVVTFSAIDSFREKPKDLLEELGEEEKLSTEQILSLWQTLMDAENAQGDALALLDEKMATLHASILAKEDAVAIHDKILPSTVSVLSHFTGQESVGYGGSGFFISTDGLIATAYHVIEGAHTIRVRTSDKKYHDVAYIAGYDVDLDVAILKVDLENTVPVVPNKTTHPEGETLYALGRHTGVDFTFTTGILAYTGDVHANYPKRRMLRYCNLTQKGDSGCAVFNAKGEAIGMCQLQDSTYGTMQWALSIAQVYTVPTDQRLTPAECNAREALDLAPYLSYEIRGGEVYVTGLAESLPKTARTVKVPATLESLPVVSVSLDGEITMPDVRTLLLPEGIRTLDRAFLSNESKIGTVTLPSTVTTVTPDAFYGASALRALVSHSSVLTVEEDRVCSFDGKTLYRVLSLPEDGTLSLAGVETVADFAAYGLPVKALTNTASLKTIGAFAFAATELSALTLPLGTQEIGESAFASSSLLSLQAEGLAVLGARALSGCHALTALTLGGAIRRIEEGAMENCTALRTLTLPEGLLYLGRGALSGTAITEITLPATVAYVGDEAFSDTPLSRVTLLSLPYLEALTAFGTPDAVESITFALPASLAAAADADPLYRALLAVGCKELLP